LSPAFDGITVVTVMFRCLVILISLLLVLPAVNSFGADAEATATESPSLEDTMAAAFQGSAEAQITVGLTYEARGSVTNALRWFLRAAEQGHPEAQFRAGMCYATGAGTAKNFAEAARLYKLSATQGFIPAWYNLGVCYEKGLGVTLDAAAAQQWYRKAAEYRDAFAQKALGVFYEQGKGGLKADPVEAQKWYLISAAQGNTEAAKLRDLLGKKLTEAQRREAQGKLAAYNAQQPANTSDTKAKPDATKKKSPDVLE